MYTFWLFLALLFSPSLPGKWQQVSNSFQAILLRLVCLSSGLSQGAHWAELPKNLPCILSGICAGSVNKIMFPSWGRPKSSVMCLRDISACEVGTLLQTKGLQCDMKSDRRHQPQVSSAPVSSLTRLHDACHLSCHAPRTHCMSLFLVHTISPHL